MSPNYPFFLYCRCRAHKREESFSIDAQKNMLLHYAEQHGLQIADIFIDTSSANAERPAFRKLLDRIAGCKASGLLTTDLSRIARNWSDMSVVTDLMERRLLKEIRTPDTIFASPFPVALFHVFSQHYRQHLSLAIKRGMAQVRLRKTSR